MASNSGLFLDWETQKPSQLGVEAPCGGRQGIGRAGFRHRPGHPDQSILFYRMASLEPGVMMPELGRSLIHQEGLDLIREYLAKMPPPR